MEKTIGGDLCNNISTMKKTNDDGHILPGWTYSYGNRDADNVQWDLMLVGEEYVWSMLHHLL